MALPPNPTDALPCPTLVGPQDFCPPAAASPCRSSWSTPTSSPASATPWVWGHLWGGGEGIYGAGGGWGHLWGWGGICGARGVLGALMGLRGEPMGWGAGGRGSMGQGGLGASTGLGGDLWGRGGGSGSPCGAGGGNVWDGGGLGTLMGLGRRNLWGREGIGGAGGSLGHLWGWEAGGSCAPQTPTPQNPPHNPPPHKSPPPHNCTP